MWRKALLAISSSILLVFGTVHAQDTYTSDIVLFVNEDALTVYIAYPEPVSLEGFQFKVVDNGETVELSPEIRFDVLVLSNYILPTGTCLVYRYNANTVAPRECDPDKTFYSRVGPGDRFWFNADDTRRSIAILKNGSTINEFCADTNSVCQIYYTIQKPVVDDASEIPPFTPPETVIESVYAETNLNSNRGSISQLDWSADGSQLISAHANGDICLWDPNKSAITSYVTCAEGAHTDGASAVAWNAASENLEFASAGGDGVIGLWMVETSPTVQLVRFKDLQHEAPVTDLVWHPSEPQLATVGDGRLMIWDTQTGELKRQFNINNPRIVDWRSDGRYLLTLDDRNVLRVIDATAQEDFTILDVYNSGLFSVDATWQPGFGNLASLVSDGSLHFYDYTSGATCSDSQCPSTLLAQNLPDVSQIRFSPQGTAVAIALRGEVHLMEAHEPYQIIGKYEVRDRTDTVFTSITWSPDGSRLAGADSQGGVHIWKISTQQSAPRIQQVAKWPVSPQGVMGIAWNLNGGGLAAVDADLKLSVWQRDGTQVGVSVAHSELPLAIDWNRAQPVIGTGGCGPTGTIWGLNAVAQIILDVDFGTTNCVTALGFDPSGQVLAMADESGVLRIWDWAANPPTLLRAKQLTLQVNDIGWNVTGNRLASVDDAGSIIVFDMTNYRPVEVFTRQPDPGVPVNSLAWSPDGTLLATASNAGWIAIWRMQGSNISASTLFDGSYLLEGHNAPVISLSWSPTNNWLVSVSEDRQLIVWDAMTGQRLAQQILDSPPSEISWAPVGASFAVADKDGYITLFDFSY